MALFGKDWSSRLATIGAGLQDVGSNLGGGQSGYLTQLQAQRQAEADKAARQQQIDALSAFFQPQTQAPQTPDAGNLPPYAAAMQQMAQGGPQNPFAPQQQAPQQQPHSMQDAIPYLTRAAAAGVNISPYLQILEAANPQKQYQGYNRDGGVLVLNPQTGKTEWIADQAGADDELKRQLLQAQIEAQHALAGTRENQGDYYQAKARQPYAPPRKSGGGSRGGSSDAPPSGFVLD